MGKQQFEKAKQQADQDAQQAEQRARHEYQRAQQAEEAKHEAEKAKQQAELRVTALEERLAASSSSTVDTAATQTFVLEDVVNQTLVASGAFKEVKRGDWHRTSVAISVLKKAHPTKAEQGVAEDVHSSQCHSRSDL